MVKLRLDLRQGNRKVALLFLKMPVGEIPFEVWIPNPNLEFMKSQSILVTIALVLSMGLAAAQQKNKTENIILITLDGMRWQEIFGGADSSLMRQQSRIKDPRTKSKYWHDDLDQRRKLLMPFMWSTVAAQGQLYGNRKLGSKVNVTNNLWFSYPGYNELLTGKADDKNITSNDKTYNPNVSVLEFINQQPAFKGKVVAFTSWDVFPYIINDKRSGVMVSTGLDGVSGNLAEREKMMNEIVNTLPNPLGDVRLDAFTFYYGLEYIKKNKPRLLYYAFDETDDLAHQGEYGAYLNSANYTDRFMSELWKFFQEDAHYKNKTTLIITCDHGRGNDASGWKSHGREVDGSDQIWLAILGPDTPALGEVKTDTQLYQNQIAATLAAFLGINFAPGHKPGEKISTVFNVADKR